MNNDLEINERIKILFIIYKFKRVSFGLLKNLLFSSARAADMLSWLEINQFISKPEDSTRWKIDCEKIENYLKSKGYNVNATDINNKLKSDYDNVEQFFIRVTENNKKRQCKKIIIVSAIVIYILLILFCG